MFIDVAWDNDFHPLDLPGRSLTRITVYTPDAGKFSRKLNKYLVDRIPDELIRDYINERDESDSVSSEGRRQLKIHVVYERDIELARRRKHFDNYTCQACKANFADLYGDRFGSVVHCHYRIPLSQLKSEQGIKISWKKDLITLCPSCHAMIHRMKGKEHDLGALINVLERGKPKRERKFSEAE